MGSIIKLPLAILILLAIQNGSNAARILGLCPLNVKSRFAMFEALMRGLAARGHQVDVVSTFPLKNPPPNYNDISVALATGTAINNRTLKEVKGYSTLNLKHMMKVGGTDVCEVLDLPQIKSIIDNPPKDPPYDLVIVETFAAECFFAFGRHLKVPLIVLVGGRLCDWLNHPLGNPPSTAFVPNVFSSFHQRMTFPERLENTVHSAIIKVLYWYHLPEQNQYVEKYFGLKLSSITELRKDIALVLVNTHRSLDILRPMTPGIVEVGGIHVIDRNEDFSPLKNLRPMTPGIVEVGGIHVIDRNEDFSPEVKKWLDESKHGFLYFSFGSMLRTETFPIENIKVFYKAFERIAPVRVLMKIGNSDELLAGLPKNVMTATWLPQTRVLQHKNVKGFITHCGLMSILESVTYGVPMIGVPLFFDQYLNMRVCEKHKVLVPVDNENITPASFTKALNTILKDSTYSENSKRLAKLFVDRPMSALDTATYWVEYVIRNGNVLRSPADELTWWQLELLDVYGFIIAVILLALFIVKKLLVVIFRLLCSKFVLYLNNKKPSKKVALISKKNI